MNTNYSTDIDILAAHRFILASELSIPPQTLAENCRNTAQSLLDQFGFVGAIDFIQYVLSPQFKLNKRHLRVYWQEVLRLLTVLNIG